MDLKFICKWFVIAGTLVIWSIKFIIRPLNIFDEPVMFFLGIAPNLIGSFLIPFGAYWLFSGKNFLIARVFSIRTNYDLRMVCLLGFFMLVVNEYLQRVSFIGRTFDYYDILFSSVGLSCSYLVFGKIQTHKKGAYKISTN